MIHLDNVARAYRDGEREIQALHPLTLHLARGETVALVGRSGSGKSTLLHLMGGLEWPSQGEVTVAGESLGRLSDAALTAFRLRHIGFVFQFFHLLPSLSVLENLTLPAELAHLPRKEGQARARRLLEAVGLDDRRRSAPDRLSGGELQRVALARALMLEPLVLLADEPTGNLDSENGARVLELLTQLTRERGTTVVLATHSHEVADWAQRRIELRDGHRVPAGGTAAGGTAHAAGGSAAPGTGDKGTS